MSLKYRRGRSKMKIILKSLFTLLLVLPALYAQAHGITEPQHGGIVKVVGDVSLELVLSGEGVAVYILDDEPWDIDGMTGKLKVESGAVKSEYELIPTPGGALSIEDVVIEKGSSVLVILTKADGYSKIAGKFSID
jgi:hypothetical protein